MSFIVRSRIDSRLGTDKKDKKDKGPKNVLFKNEKVFESLKNKPYCFYSFIFFYKRGDLINAIDCLQHIDYDMIKPYLQSDNQDFSLRTFIKDIKTDLVVL